MDLLHTNIKLRWFRITYFLCLICLLISTHPIHERISIVLVLISMHMQDSDKYNPCIKRLCTNGSTICVIYDMVDHTLRSLIVGIIRCYDKERVV